MHPRVKEQHRRHPQPEEGDDGTYSGATFFQPSPLREEPERRARDRQRERVEGIARVLRGISHIDDESARAVFGDGVPFQYIVSRICPEDLPVARPTAGEHNRWDEPRQDDRLPHISH